MVVGCAKYLAAGVVNNPVLVRCNRYGSGIVDSLINNTDKLDKLAKFFETFFRGFQQLVANNPVSTASLKIIKQTSSWLTAVQIVGDGEFFVNCASYAKKGFLEFSKKLTGVASHLFATLNFAKECGSAVCMKIDQQFGKVAIFGIQFSLKVAKDLSGILMGGIGIAQQLNSILYDREGNPRSNLLHLIFTGRFNEFLSEDTIVKLLNNISKIYILSSVIIGAPYTVATFAMGLILGTTTLMSLAKSYEDEQRKKAREYHANVDLVNQIPVAPRKALVAVAA